VFRRTLRLPPVWLHDVLAHYTFRHQAVMAAAQEPQIRRVDRSMVCDRLDVVNLEPFPALATRSVRGDKGALTTIADENKVPDYLGDVMRDFGRLPLVGVDSG
jgi:hypothetical protein